MDLGWVHLIPDSGYAGSFRLGSSMVPFLTVDPAIEYVIFLESCRMKADHENDRYLQQIGANARKWFHLKA